MKRHLLAVGVASVSLLISIGMIRADQPGTGRAAAEPSGSGLDVDQPALEKKLAQDLSNSRLSGFYMIEGQQGPPQQDEYRLGAVEKQPGGKWLIHARIAYGQKAVNVPLEIPIVWAGDTPVISVTDMIIPGLGTYTARVMIYGDHYAGTWSSPRHNGYLWGRITHIPATQHEPGSEERNANP